MRKTITYEVTSGRDKGKKFIITEMPARKAHNWATRALVAVMKGGVNIPENIMDMGFAGIAAMGIRSLRGIDDEKAIPLMDELLECVTVPGDIPNVTRKLFDEDVEDVTTLFKLQIEVVKLHMDFSTPGTQ